MSPSSPIVPNWLPAMHPFKTQGQDHFPDQAFRLDAPWGQTPRGIEGGGRRGGGRRAVVKIHGDGEPCGARAGGERGDQRAYHSFLPIS